MAGSQKSGIRWWMWISIILGGAASFLLVTILMRRREAKREVAPVRRIELKPEVQARAAKPLRPAKSKPARADDLMVIEGIGPKTAASLQSSGIKTYAQLSAAGAERIKGILTENGIRANPTTWPEQAELAAAGEWKALEAMQAKLKGGRRA
jgi:predicted flap endonuclease-1-like 5' DNA nuclease